MSHHHRAELVPNANNPRLLLRMARLIAAGLRRPRALSDVLEVEPRTVAYYTQAGEWLGLMATAGGLHLTEIGLAVALAEAPRRDEIYARAVWQNPFARELMSGRGQLPDADTIAIFIQSREPDLASATARRRATAVRSLLEPALAYRSTSEAPPRHQLTLPFARGTGVSGTRPFQVDLRAGTEDNPDVYSHVLVSLLAHGELSLGNLRAVLDGAGATQCGIGTYADMAVRRGDASRMGDQLVLSPDAIQRAPIAWDPLLIALSDPAYRAYLEAMVDADALSPRRSGPGAAEEIRKARALAQTAARFADWDRRLFGARLEPGSARAAVSAIAPGRRLEGLPRAGEPAPTADGQSLDVEVAEPGKPFVDCLEDAVVNVAFSECIAEIVPGVGQLNDALRSLREQPANRRMPGVVQPTSRFHRGLLAPGERLPRALTDNLSVRLRALTHCPPISLLGALLLLHRRTDLSVTVELRQGVHQVRWGRRWMGPLIDVLAAFCTSRGWHLARRPLGGLDSEGLVQVCRSAGVVTDLADQLALNETLFLKLQEDPEARLVYEALVPLSDALQQWLDSEQKRSQTERKRARGEA